MVIFMTCGTNVLKLAVGFKAFVLVEVVTNFFAVDNCTFSTVLVCCFPVGGIILYVLANYWNVIVLLTLRAERRQMHAGCTSGALVCCSITNYHHKEAKIFH